jgi:diguanylate cyclase (GGDEF)-like protein/PAS domain S-box-containing protein
MNRDPTTPLQAGDALAGDLASRFGDAFVRLVADNVPTLISYHDVELHYRYANRPYLEFFGTTEAQLYGKTLPEFLGPEIWRVVRPNIEKVLAGLPAIMRRVARSASGAQRTIEITSLPHRDAAGNVIGIFSTIIDVTGHLEIEQALRESETRFRKLAELSSDFYWETDREHRITVRTESSAASSVFASPEHWLGKRRWEMPYETPDEAGWRAHRAVLDSRQPFREFEFSRRAGDGSVRHFAIDGEPMFDGAGAFVGYRGVGRDITPRKLAEQALRASEARMRLIADNVPAMIALTDRRNVFRYANRNMVELYGRDDRELLGNDIASVVGPEAWPLIRPNIERALGGEAVSYSGRRQHRSGEWREVEVTLVPQKNAADGVEGVYTFILDVTDRNRAEQAIHSREAQLRLLVDNVPAMIAYIGTDRRYLFSNRNYTLFFTGRDEPLEGRDMAQVIGEANWSTARPLVEAAFAGAMQNYRRKSRRASDGSLRDLDVTLVPNRNDAGDVIGIYSMLIDVTRRRRAEEALRLRNRALDSTLNGIMIAEQAQGELRLVYVNPAFERITGYASQDVLGRNPDFLLGEDRRQSPIADLRAALAAEREVTVLLRNFRKDGSLFWNELHIAPVRDSQNRATHFVGVCNDVTQRVSYEAELERHANYDSLSGLPNRNLLRDRVERAIAHAGRTHRLAAVLYVDLDHLKRINDSLGHAVGDLVIAAVGGRLAGITRGGDTVARIGGDEFVVVLGEIRREEDAVRVADKVRRAVAAPLRVEGHDFVLSASVGIALYPRDGTDAATLQKNADTALYRAKEEGRDGWRFFTAEMNAEVVRRLSTEQQLRGALEAGEFRLHYQPIVSLPDGEIVGAEALLRWRRSDGALIGPNDFIPVAEESGLIVPIGAWVLKTATQDARAWQRAGYAPVFVSVNLSARQFRDPRLAHIVREALRASRLPAAQLKLEITETTVMQNAEETDRTLRALKRLGVRLSVDDFGTGYSSLAYLKRFPLDVLKIDRGFVRDLSRDKDDLAISRAVIDLARGMKLQVVAEGVELREQARLLSANGCQLAQGFYFGRPVEAERFARRLRKSAAPAPARKRGAKAVARKRAAAPGKRKRAR